MSYHKLDVRVAAVVLNEVSVSGETLAWVSAWQSLWLLPLPSM